MSNRNPFSIQQLLAVAYEKLASCSDSPRLDADVLLAWLLQKQRSFLFTWPEQIVKNDTIAQYEALIQRRQQGEPLAYITGVQEFWSLQLEVTRNTLIPRPETEVLVEQALTLIPSNKSLSILDLGTGSGAIALAIASERPLCKITAVDNSQAALNVAKSNAARLGINNIEFLVSDWFSELELQVFDLIVSNPPYIAEADPHLDKLDYEPIQALCSGKFGLDDISQIIREAKHFLKPSGYLLFEHGWNQASLISELFTEASYSHSFSAKDLSQHFRVTGAQFSTAI
ncbi:MAG: peptide chain release factor N(5)-glutamine methyltransferase [Gammaproteobacteria bacterium]|nr:peptide chain release factor N(5)-glutamine methyltransferase [Gammaproteobacteria bacterium]MDH5727425.1 peptide chain release factor N(5)-glutamine methyltransferase [Gammaproteobacteria bacterium]